MHVSVATARQGILERAVQCPQRIQRTITFIWSKEK